MTKKSDIFIQNTDDKINHSNEQNDRINQMIDGAIKDLENFKDSQISVFISSTQEDLHDERNAISKLVIDMGFELISMESFGARTESPLSVCLSELKKADVYVCILGMRYGTLCKNPDDQNGHKLSFTEIEYNNISKIREGKDVKILIYCIDERNARIHPIYVDKGEGASELERFKKKVKEEHVVYQYNNIDSLIYRLARDLQREGQTIQSKRKDNAQNTIHQSGTPDASISISTDSEIAYLDRPIQIFGKTNGLNTSKLYLFLTENESKFPPEDDEILQLNEFGKKYVSIPLANNGSWTYALDLHNLGKKIKKGLYTIIVTSSPQLNQKDIVHVSHSLMLRIGYITVSTSAEVLSLGLPFTIKGVAQTRSPYVYLWICSKNNICGHIKIPVTNEEYTYTFSDELMNHLVPDQYFVVVDMPVTDEKGNVWLEQNEDMDYLCSTTKKIPLNDEEQGNIATKIIDMICKQGGLQAHLSFICTEPKIVPSKHPKDCKDIIINSNSIILSEETNLPSGTLILVDLYQRNPTKLTQKPYILVDSIVTNTYGSEKNSHFSAVFNITNLPPEEYKVQVRLGLNNKILIEENWRKE